MTAPGTDGDPDRAPAVKTVICPGCGATAALHADDSITCPEYGHMDPDQAALARRGGWIADQLNRRELTVHQALDILRRWTP